MRLIEPLGLLDSEAGSAAIEAGVALPMAGGPLAFSLARLIDTGRAVDRVVAVGDLPDGWDDVLARVTRAAPVWAGLPSGRAGVMGVVNVTPDSFSDGGDRFGTDEAIRAGRDMASAGAAIIDIGGETTRPGSQPTAPEVEQARILPVIQALADGPPISVDTRNASTMSAALAAGATIINDVSGLAHDVDAASVVAGAGCPVVLMHMRGDPASMNRLATYADVALEVLIELAGRLEAAEAAGISRARIAIDPGIGFAKIGSQNHVLLNRLPLFLNLGCPILVGLSRKRFIGELGGGELGGGELGGEAGPKRRGPGSLAGALYAAARGARLLRVHDVAPTVQALRVWQGIQDGAIPSVCGGGAVNQNQ